MERRNDPNPKKEEGDREHARSDRSGPGREQRPQHFPGQEGRPDFERTQNPAQNPTRPMDESRREPAERGQNPPSGSGTSREQPPRKFGERRDQPREGRRDRQGSR